MVVAGEPGEGGTEGEEGREVDAVGCACGGGGRGGVTSRRGGFKAVEGDHTL